MKNLMGELLIMKTYSIKPNFSALSREYGLDRHTIKKYYEEGGIKRKKMERERFFDKYRDETKLKQESILAIASPTDPIR